MGGNAEAAGEDKGEGEAERPRVKFKIRARVRVMAVTEGRQGVLGVEMRRPWWSDAPRRL